jgi:tryptophan synthase alpha chain
VKGRLGEVLRNKRVLMIYLTIGDPLLFDRNVIEALTSQGIEVFELGVPTDKPKYDGPTIRASHRRALSNGITMDTVFKLIREFPERKILFSYFDLALNLNPEKLMQLAVESKVESILFPDLLIDYFEKLNSYVKLCEKYDLEPSFFITSSFPHKLVSKLAELNPAFIYLGLMASTGILLPITVTKTIKIMRMLVKEIPLVVGFALRTPQQVTKCIEAGADGVVIGSSILKLLEKTLWDERNLALKNYISSLISALMV